MATQVVHFRFSAYDYYIGRTPKLYRVPPEKDMSAFSNPFMIGKDGTRDEVVEKYDAYIRQRLKSNPGLVALLHTLRGKRLGCWCHPYRCHGDVLVQLIAELS